MKLDYRYVNPNGFHLMKYLQDKTIRYIIMYGGSSSGKSYSVAQCILTQTIWDGASTLVMRKVGASIKDSIYQDFKTAAEQLHLSDYFEFKDGIREIRCKINKGKIVFKGCDDAEKIKGISSFKRVVLDEWSEFDEVDFKQIRLRLRGMEGQQIICTFNPIKETHWIKRNIFDKEEWHYIESAIDGLPPELTEVKSIRLNSPKTIMHKRTGELIEHPSDMVVIQSTYLNNFWVVGSPNGKYGYYDDQCIATFESDRVYDPDYYNVYALGEWGVIRTGSEFFASFNRGIHVGSVAYNPSLPIHISVDNNVLPYITTTFWQIDLSDGVRINQIDELCAESPNNTVRKAAKLVAARLKEYGADKVYLHGDASTKAANTIDDDKRSFLDLYIDTLEKEGIEVVDCVGNKNPSVSMSGEFINAILERILPEMSITIDERCKVSIEDYMSVQKDVNGAILKTRVKNKITNQTYEEHGHCSDTFRYLVCDVCKEAFLAFSNKRKRNLYARDGVIRFFNPDTECSYSANILYVMPNVSGKYCFVHGMLCGDNWHIVDAGLYETTSTDEIKRSIMAEGDSLVVVECSTAYYPFVRELRSIISDVKIVKETTDVDRRISATSDYVKSNILFSESRLNDSEDYSAFMTSLLDYRKDGDTKEASTALSGFVKYVVRNIQR